MKILVLLAGVADIRFPLHTLSIGAEGLIEENGNARRLLSPFDEAALELALKLRDARSDCQIDVLLLAGANNEAMLRTVAAFRPNSLRRLDLQPACPWDARLTAGQIAGLLKSEGGADLLLIGREFGDLDEGSIPVLLAQRLGYPLFALAQHAEWAGGQVRLLRERGAGEESLEVSQPLLASVTNDKRNKLRHPLMKNVMEAKRMSFAGVTAGVEEPTALPLASLGVARVSVRGGQCRMLEGSAAQQASALLAYLNEQGVGA
ncbi:electron transfer flavoprotein subunit beta [Pseudomonas cavernae]|uniref:Electron transfer flavoprotein subunit beta n=1 Tax=Pseudomonas cavernae TaxID=2320867 RepID=A0A385Z506_9PSED|nr:electron transfer flavoprotein subunit beta [Pseudomonas cavernae]AYC33023.1 electron transfer flavoprotein subunit beta [Pseudomonas cavernae]